MGSFDSFNSSMDSSYSDSGSLDCTDGAWIVESMEHAMNIDLIMPRSQRVMLGMIAPLMAIVGLILNLAFFFVLIRVPDMHTTTNFYLANLAVADCLFLIFSTAINMWQAIHLPVSGAHPFQTNYGCGFFFWVNYLYYFASIMFVTLVTLDRYMAVCHPIRYRTSKTRGRTTALAVGIWGVACLYAAGELPNFVRLETHCYRWPEDEFFDGFADVVNYCLPVNLHWAFPNIFLVLQIIPFVVAMIASIFFYASIIITLSRSTSHRRQSQSLNSKHQKRRNQIAIMLLVMASCFFICELPFLVSSIIQTDITKELSHDTYVIITIVSRFFLYLNSSINPIIYNALSPTYRRAFVAAFTCQRGQSLRSSYLVSSTKVSTFGSSTSEKNGNYLRQNSSYV